MNVLSGKQERKERNNGEGVLNTSHRLMQRLPGSCEVSSTEKMVDNFSAPDDTSEEVDGDNREDTMTHKGEASERVEREEERAPSSQKKVPLMELNAGRS